MAKYVIFFSKGLNLRTGKRHGWDSGLIAVTHITTDTYMDKSPTPFLV